MQGRKATSLFKKSQSLPVDLISIVQEALREEFQDDLPKNTKVTGRIYPGEILVRVGWPSTEEGLRHMNVEASIDFELGKQDPTQLIHVALDALQSALEEYFDAEGDIEVPRAWKEFTFEKHTVFLQFTAVNAKLEDAADEFLKDHGFLEDGTTDSDDGSEFASESLESERHEPDLQ